MTVNNASERPGPDDGRNQAVAEKGGNVDKIRDILFGSQMRDYDSRFARLEENLLKESADLRETTKKRLDVLEDYIKKEMDSLASRLKTEREERTTTLKQYTKEMKESDDGLTAKLGELGDNTTKAQGELRRDLLDQSKKLTEEIRSTQEAVLSTLDRRYRELRGAKVDRAALAEFLTEVALRLNDEFRMPDSEG